MKKNRQLRKQYKILRRIKEYQPQMSELTDKELSGLTNKFKKRLNAGESLDDLLPEAFAAICEADKRVLGKYPYDVQIVCGIALHQGYLTEMNTGEGKTLTATLPLYLNALTGKGAILVTANDYLALRDEEEMGQVYQFMGLTAAAGVRTSDKEPFTNEEKKQVYNSDIVYTTHGTLGFDYLLNNLVTRAKDRFMRKFNYVIIDEADSVLLDGAQMPLVISGSPRVQSNLYEIADFFVKTLIEDRDYETEDKKVWLTKEGVRYAESFFQIDNFYGEEHFEINRHVTLALRANVLFKNRKDYMISVNGKLDLLDGESGRLMPGVKLRGGQHQALEMKENLEVSQEARSVASITYQNLFLLFDKMAGMSGTMADANQELMDVYGKKVLVIPPNRTIQRRDLDDLYFQDNVSQIDAAIKAVLKIHKTGQPVLIVVSNIMQTELVSKLLFDEGIPHNVLNANNAFWEADIIKEAGQMDAVTVSTSMAGRGTDIKLGKDVKELGGLAVIGIGRMTNVRQERQARGRSGRQGDPGFSQFYVSLQDEVVKNSGYPKLDKYIEKRSVSKHKLKKIIDGSQSTNEEYAVMSRKQAVSYDQVLQKQREMIYEIRNNLLDGNVQETGSFREIAWKNIKSFTKSEKHLNTTSVNRYILDNISYHLDKENLKVDLKNRKTAEKFLMKRVIEGFEEQKNIIGNEKHMNEFMRIAALNALDDAWVEQVDYLQQLQAAVGGRSTAQRNPVYEYQEDAFESFSRMENSILRNIMRNTLLSDVYIDDKRELHITLP